MSVGADAVNRPLPMAGPHQGALSKNQGSANEAPCSFASAQYPLKVAYFSAGRPGGAARWSSVADSSDGMQKPGGAGQLSAGSVYERIKSSLLQRPWAPGELLQIGMFARELGTSTTPVREALARLAAERLITYTPKKGFLVKAVTEEELRGLYIVNQMLLQTALHYSGEPESSDSEGKSRVNARVSAGLSDSATELAFTIANLFLGITAAAGVEEITAMMGSINSRLHHPRVAEHAVVADIAQETTFIGDLFAAGEHAKLHEALGRYHNLRLQMLPLICRELLSMSFVKR